MNIDKNEKLIKDALNTIKTPNSNIKFKVNREVNTQKSPTYFRKTMVGICAACLSLVLCVPVMASSPSFQKLLSSIDDNFNSQLKPIQMVSEDNGIIMEVVAAMNDDDMAVIYVTLQDLVGDRIDETVDLYDSYRLSKGSAFGAQTVNYDEESKTATIRIQANGGRKLSNKEISFNFTKFLSGKVKVESRIDNDTLKNALNSNNVEMTSLDMNNISGGGGDLYNEYKEKGIINILNTNKDMNIEIPNVDFVKISSIGILEDRLHIQTKWKGEGKDEHGFLFLTDNKGNKIEVEEANIYFGVDEEGNTTYGNEYIEYIFDINNISIQDLNINGYFVANKNFTEGNWETKFKLQPIKDKKEIKCDVALERGSIEKVEVSSLGVTLSGKDFEVDNIDINMIDGTTQTLISNIRSSKYITTEYKFIGDLPLKISGIESISVEGNIIEIN